MQTGALVTWRRLRSAGELSRAAKVLWFVWVLTASGIYPRPPVEMALTLFTTLGAMIGLVAMGLSFDRSTGSTRAGSVHAGEGSVTIRRDDREVTLDRASVASAYASGQRVEITAKDGDVWEFVLADDASAHAVVSELGFGRDGSPVVFDTAAVSRAGHVALGAVSLMAAAFLSVVAVPPQASALVTPLAVVLTALFYTALKTRLRAPVVTVGADGVHIEKAESEFIPLDQIRGVEQLTPFAPLRLLLVGGRVLTIGAGTDRARRNALALHLHALLARPRQSASLGVARDGLPVREWRERLRVALNGAGYRVAASAPVDTALAERMVSPGVPAEERVGAALALRIADPASGAARVRVAAQACLDPHMRAVLEAASADEIDDDALERALEGALDRGAARRFPTLEVE